MLSHSPEELLRRCVDGIRKRHERNPIAKRKGVPLSSVIAEYVGLGSASAEALCKWADADPDELVNYRSKP